MLVSKTVSLAVVKAFEKTQQMLEKSQVNEDKAIQAHVDAMKIAQGSTPDSDFLKGNAATNPAKKEVRELMQELVKNGLKQKTADNLQTCYWIAFTTNVPFARSLFKKTGKGNAKPAETKSGAVKSTTREALDKTLTKAIQQARLLGLTGFAAEMFDLCNDSLDGGFKEIEESK